jgi:NADH:ubiquinone oxidoreductase subunit 5 (subunit L)/multisubunit Na+/H+ antiporter MnhA subunit
MVIWRTGIHDVREGGGLVRQMPATFALMCVAGLSLSGLPLLSGYISKTLLEEAATETGYGLLAAIAVVSSVLTFMGIARLIWCTFLAKREHGPAPIVREAPIQALLPIGILVAGSILIGIFPSWMVEHVTRPAANALIDRERYIAEVMTPATVNEVLESAHPLEEVPEPLDWHHWGIPAAIVLVGGVGTYVLVERRSRPLQTWMRPLQWIARLTREWHTGLITDYALWNAFGTAFILILLLLANRLGFL